MTTSVELHPIVLGEVLLVEGLTQNHIHGAETIHHLPQRGPWHHGESLGVTVLETNDFGNGITQQTGTAGLPEAGKADGHICTRRLHRQFGGNLENLKLAGCIDPHEQQRISIGQSLGGRSVVAVTHPVGINAHQQNSDRRLGERGKAGGVVEGRRDTAGHLIRFRPHHANQPTHGTCTGKQRGNPEHNSPRMPLRPLGLRLRFGGRHRPSNANGA